MVHSHTDSVYKISITVNISIPGIHTLTVFIRSLLQLMSLNASIPGIPVPQQHLKGVDDVRPVELNHNSLSEVVVDRMASEASVKVIVLVVPI